MNPADETAAKIEPTERQLAGDPSPPPKPVEEVDDLLLAISRHLDDEASERKASVGDRKRDGKG
jgi:hypothetical protein